MGLSTTHLLLLLLVVILLFGSSRISTLMGDVAKGIKSFKKGMEEDDAQKKSSAQPRSLEQSSRSQEGKSPDIK